MDINNLSEQEILELAAQFSGFNDSGDPSDYSGFGDPDVEFIGKDVGGSFFNMNDQEAFSLQIVNSNPSARTFHLSMGLDYLEGSETKGQLRNGTFAAEDDAGTGTSLTASATISGQSIARLIRFTRQNPTITPKIDVVSTQPKAQLALTNTIIETGILKDGTAKQIKWRKYADAGAFNLEFLTLQEQIYLGQKWLVKIPVAGNSTLSLDLYFGAAINQSAQLERRVEAAVATAAQNPGVVRLAQTQGKVIASRGSLSKLNKLNVGGNTNRLQIK